MEYVKESYLCGLICSLWAALVACYEESALHRFLVAAGRWCNAQIDTSALLGVLCREGRVARDWRESRCCRLISALVNLPGALLHRLYLAGKPLFDTSFFANLAFAMGDETAIGESWMILLLWCIPFSRWNNAYSLLGFALLVCLFLVRSMHRKSARLDVRGLGPYTVGMFVAVCLAVPLSAYPGLSARFLFYHLAAALCVLVTVSAIRSTEELKRLAAASSGVVLVSSLYAVYQRIQGVEVNESYVDLSVNAGMPGRVESYFDNPNTFAEVLILLLPLTIALIFASRRWRFRLLALAVACVGAAALGMTYSRASWVGIACAAVVFVFLWKPKLIPAFAAVCILCIPLLPDTIWNRILTITNTSDKSTASRLPIFEAALRVIGRSPVTGAGLGTAAVQEYINVNNLYHDHAPFVHSHNFYLQVWVEAGLLGVVSFVGSALWNIKNAARTVRHCPDSAARILTCGGCCSLCGILVCGLADYPWNYPRVMCMFWFVFAMTIAGARLCLESSRQED